MPWSSGTYSRTNGVNTGSTTWAQDEAAGTDILSSRHDTHDQDLATGINSCVNKDGSNAFTGNADLGANRITDVGAATALTDAPQVTQVQNSAFIDCGTAGGSKNALTLSPSPAITAYAAGQTFRFKNGSTASDDAVTVAISGLPTKAVEMNDSALSASVVLDANKHYEIKYDGTAFQATRLSAAGASLGANVFTGTQDLDGNELVLDADGDTSLTADTDDQIDVKIAGSDVANWTSAALNLLDKILQRPVLKDYGETVNALGDLGGGTDDIDLTLGNVVSATVSTATQTFTFSNPPASGTAGSFTLFLTNGGSQTVTWPASVDWAGGAAPTLTSSGVDILTFTTIDGGTTWYGFAAGLAMA